MKKLNKLCLCLVLAAATPALANEPAGFADLGLGSLEMVSDDAGMGVRGMSASAQASGLSAFAAIVFDPLTNSQFNFNANNFALASDQNAGIGPVALSAAGVETSVGITAWEVNIGEFSASFNAALLFGAGQGVGSGDFQITAPIFTPVISGP